MMYTEFCERCARAISPETYYKNVEPAYMQFETVTKDEIAFVFAHRRSLWEEMDRLTKEKQLVDETAKAEKVPTVIYDLWMNRWQDDVDGVLAKIKKLGIDK